MRNCRRASCAPSSHAASAAHPAHTSRSTRSASAPHPAHPAHPTHAPRAPRVEMRPFVRNLIVAFIVVVVTIPFTPLVFRSLTHNVGFNRAPDFSLDAWEDALQNPQVITALANSFILCALVIAISLAFSFFAAKNLGTRRFRGRRAVQLLLLVPSFVPQISLVFGMQRVFSKVGLYNNFWGILVAELVFYVPYLTLLLSAVFEDYDLNYELQARSLGASSWHIFWHVTLPGVRSGVIVACIFSFIGVWASYLTVLALAPPSYTNMATLAFPLINSSANGEASVACVTLLYIMPAIAILVIFSRLLANDTNRLRNARPGGML